MNSVSVAAAASNPSGIKTILANDLSTFLIKCNPFFRNGPKNLTKNPLDCPILRNWPFDNFILAYEPIAKALQSFEYCVSVNNNLCSKNIQRNFQRINIILF